MTPATTWSSARTGRAKRRRASRRCSARPPISRSPRTAPSSSTPRTCPTSRRCRRATRCSRCRRTSSSRRLPAAPAIDFPKIDKELVKTNFFEYLDFALQFAPAGPEEEAIRAKLASIGIGPGKKFNFKDLSVEHKAAILLAMKEGDSKVEKYLRGRAEGHQRLEGRLAVRRPRFLQRRLAEARRRRQGRHLRQRCRRSHVSPDQDAGQRRRARRQPSTSTR